MELQFLLWCLARIEWLLCKFSVLVECSFPGPLARDRELFGFLLVNFILVQKLAFVFIDSLYYIVTFSFY